MFFLSVGAVSVVSSFLSAAATAAAGTETCQYASVWSNYGLLTSCYSSGLGGLNSLAGIMSSFGLFFLGLSFGLLVLFNVLLLFLLNLLLVFLLSLLLFLYLLVLILLVEKTEDASSLARLRSFFLGSGLLSFLLFLFRGADASSFLLSNRL